MKKLTLVIGIAIGYVIGTRQGRAGYEKLKNRARDLWSNPRVQRSVDKAQDAVREKVPAAGDAVDDAVDSIDEKLASSTPSEELPDNME